MTRFEPLVLERRPDLVLVYGDVNSTIAAALVCAKLGIKVGHVRRDCGVLVGRCRKKLTGWLQIGSPIFCLLHLKMRTRSRA
jgi:hypothetical protein